MSKTTEQPVTMISRLGQELGRLHEIVLETIERERVAPSKAYIDGMHEHGVWDRRRDEAWRRHSAVEVGIAGYAAESMADALIQLSIAAAKLETAAHTVEDEDYQVELARGAAIAKSAVSFLYKAAGTTPKELGVEYYFTRDYEAAMPRESLLDPVQPVVAERREWNATRQAAE